MELRKLEPFTLANHGLVTLHASRRAGISDASWYRACATGQIELLHPGVARVLDAPATVEQRIGAAVLAAGSGAMASHRSAAFLWELPRPGDEPVDVTLPGRDRHSRLKGVVLHRPRDLVDLTPTRRRNIATTKLLRALSDLGAVDPDGVHPAVGHVVTNGVRALRDALDDWLFDGEALDSELERRMKRLAKRFRLPAMTFHAVICGHEVDFLIDGTPIVLECDGWEFHDKGRHKFERDRLRNVELVAAGYITVQFTWHMLTRQPQWVATKVNDAVRRWAPHLLNASGRQSSRIS